MYYINELADQGITETHPTCERWSGPDAPDTDSGTQHVP